MLTIRTNTVTIQTDEMKDYTDHVNFANVMLEKLSVTNTMPVIVTVPADMVQHVKVPSSPANGVVVVPDDAQFLQFPPTE